MAKHSREKAESITCAAAVPAAFSREGAARYLGISVRTLGRLMSDGSVKPRQIRGRLTFLRSELDAYLAALPVAR